MSRRVAGRDRRPARTLLRLRSPIDRERDLPHPGIVARVSSVPERWTRTVLRFRVPVLAYWLVVVVVGAIGATPG